MVVHASLGALAIGALVPDGSACHTARALISLGAVVDAWAWSYPNKRGTSSPDDGVLGSSTHSPSRLDAALAQLLARESLQPLRVFDVGANKGQSMNRFLRSPWPRQIRVTSFEPGEVAFKMLKGVSDRDSLQVGSLGRGGAKRAEAVQCAVSNVTAVVSFAGGATADEGNHLDPSGADTWRSHRKVNVDTVEHLLAARNLTELDFLKGAHVHCLTPTNQMSSVRERGLHVCACPDVVVPLPRPSWPVDVEGYEMLVLRGAAAVLRRQGIKALQLEYGTHWFRTGQAHDNDRATLAQLVAFLDACGYEVYYVTQGSLLRLNEWHAAFELPVGSARPPLRETRTAGHTGERSIPLAAPYERRSQRAHTVAMRGHTLYHAS